MNDVAAAPAKDSMARLKYLLFLGVGIGIGWFVAKAPEIIQGKPPEVVPVDAPVDNSKGLVAPISPF